MIHGDLKLTVCKPPQWRRCRPNAPCLIEAFSRFIAENEKPEGTNRCPRRTRQNSSRRTPMSRVPRGPALAGDGTLSSRSSQSIGRSEIECSPVHDDKPLHRKGQFLVWAKRCRPQWGLSAAGQYWRALWGSARSRCHPSNTSGFAANHIRGQLSTGTGGNLCR
jgi:hypothetical protein